MKLGLYFEYKRLVIPISGMLSLSFQAGLAV